MMDISDAVYGQFEHPRGLLGSLAGAIMANRSSNRERNRWTVELLNVEPTSRVLEIGCGPGYALSLLSRLFSAGKRCAWRRKLTACRRSSADGRLGSSRPHQHRFPFVSSIAHLKERIFVWARTPVVLSAHAECNFAVT